MIHDVNCKEQSCHIFLNLFRFLHVSLTGEINFDQIRINNYKKDFLVNQKTKLNRSLNKQTKIAIQIHQIKCFSK